jgi:hypothetical protein
MKLSRLLPVTLPLVLSLPVLAHLDPLSKLPTSDVAPSLAVPDMVGPVFATWMQDASGKGRMTGELIGQNGGPRLLLDALIEPDLNSPIDNPMQVGIIRGQLYKDDGTDPLFAESDLYVVGTFALLPDYGEASCLILRYQEGVTPVEVIGQVNGTLDLSNAQPLVLQLPFPASDSVGFPTADAVQQPTADAAGVSQPDADAAQPAADAAPAASQTDHSLIAPFHGRWRIFA